MVVVRMSWEISEALRFNGLSSPTQKWVLEEDYAALAAELEAVKVQLAKEQQSVNELVAAVQEMGRENKRLRLAAQAIVAAADKSDTDEVYRNMRVLRAALAVKEVR